MRIALWRYKEEKRLELGKPLASLLIWLWKERLKKKRIDKRNSIWRRYQKIKAIVSSERIIIKF